MRNTLRQIETENIVVYQKYTYGLSFITMAHKFVSHMIQEGIIKKGEFNDDKWICFDGVKNYELNFDFDKTIYEKHLGKEFGITYTTMKQMIKCYVVYCTGVYVFRTLARSIVNTIKYFLCNYKENEFKLSSTGLYHVEDFLAFINTDDSMIDNILLNIKRIPSRKHSVRKLSHLIHYLIIENEINKLFNSNITNEEFIKYFPIYFWVNVTFILPLRATEMLVTPFDCIEINDEKITLKVRRTNLKSGKYRVYYDIDKDYDIFSYQLNGIINNQVFDKIQLYQNMTKNHERRFLFDYGVNFSNELLSLSGFNNLIRVFIDEKIKNNSQYEYAKSVCNIKEFEYVTAGDSRPIAMANLFFQGAGLDICRQLANHTNISTSEGYFTNVSQTLYCSSVMKMQNKINNELLEKNTNKSDLIIRDKFGCSSAKRILDKTNIEDCKGHYEDCFGCKFYYPNDKEINKYMADRKEKFENYTKKMQNLLTSTNKIKGKNIDINELFLKVHTTGVNYKESTDVFAEKEANKWVEQQNSPMNYY